MKISDKIKAKLQGLPDTPGVYLMRDRHGRIIYIGKAVSLKNRVRWYFRKGTLKGADPKLRGLVRSIHDVDYMVVRNEAEAVLNESRLIKEYRPRYNVVFRDDKRFLLLRIDLNDPFPRFKTCRIKRDDGATYFGPYASSASARAAIEFCEKRFGVRRCAPRIPGEEHYKHCMNDIIRFCSAPCIDKIDRTGYMDRVAQACAFLRGESPEYLREIEEAMQQEAEARHFEKAAALRDTLFLLRDAVKQRIRGAKSPAMKKEDAQAGLSALQAALALPEPPRVIECFDISNISGTYAVGSMVCSVGGLPQKNRYRLFRIKTVQGIDDPAMMAELIQRRYARVIQEKQKRPDLVLVDGGITQLRAAQSALNHLGLRDLPVAGLAKKFEEIHYERNHSRAPIRFSLDSPALRLLQYIRDEAHRFALTYHRNLRHKRIQESALDDIEGIGAKRKKLLLEHFGSLARLRKATAEEIALVPGIGKIMGETIKAHIG